MERNDEFNRTTAAMLRKDGLKKTVKYMASEYDIEVEEANYHVYKVAGECGIDVGLKKYMPILYAAIIIGVIVIFGAIQSGQKREYSSKKTGVSDEHAFYMAKKVVEAALKAPSTANFCTYADAKLTRMENILIINGWVDASNSFGAMLRSNWSVQLLGPPTNYQLGEVYFDGTRIK